MNDPATPTPVLRLSDGIQFKAGPVFWSVGPLKIMRGQWVAFVPDGPDPVVDPAGPLARTLASLSPPHFGTVKISGADLYRMPYGELQRKRADIGFVQGYGGLLSNRSLKDNISLPLSVHGHLTIEEEILSVTQTIERFDLSQVADLKPHEVDGATRWKTCIARALILSPGWVVLEGIGNWEMDRGRGVAWARFRENHNLGESTAAICLSRQNPEFEAWFKEVGGQLVRYSTRAADKVSRSSMF